MILQEKSGITVMNYIFTPEAKNSVGHNLVGPEQDEWYELCQTDKDIELSYEFAIWFYTYTNGQQAPKELNDRYREVGIRIGCYRPELLYPITYNLTASGLETAKYVRQVIRRLQLSRYAKTGRFELFALDDIRQMEEIVLYGHFPRITLNFLGTFYNLSNPTERLISADPEQFNLETVKNDLLADNITYVTMRSVRKNPVVMRRVETLLKFGLIDAKELPKEQKGRRPLGLTITALGAKFYQNYCSRMVANAGLVPVEGITLANPHRGREDLDLSDLVVKTNNYPDVDTKAPDFYEKVDKLESEAYENNTPEHTAKIHASDKPEESGFDEIMRMKRELQQMTDGTLTEPRKRLPTAAELRQMPDSPLSSEKGKKSKDPNNEDWEAIFGDPG